MDLSPIWFLLLVITPLSIGLIQPAYFILAVIAGIYVRRKVMSSSKSSRTAFISGLSVTLILVALPFWDYPLTKIRLNELCKNESGFEISKSIITGVDGIFGLQNAIRFGYLYGDDYLTSNDRSSLRRFSKAEEDKKSGYYTISKIDKPSPYAYRRSVQHVSTNINKIIMKTYETETNVELGRFVYFSTRPIYSGKISINDFRPWMKMDCPGVEHGGISQLRELLAVTLPPSSAAPE